MKIVLEKIFIKSLWRVLKDLAIISVESIGDAGIVKIDENNSTWEIEAIIVSDIGMKP